MVHETKKYLQVNIHITNTFLIEIYLFIINKYIINKKIKIKKLVNILIYRKKK